MLRHRGIWIALTLVLGLFAGAALTLDAQTNPETGPEAAGSPPAVDMEALLAMERGERFDAIRAMHRDDRIAVLRSLDREERRAFRAYRRGEAATQGPAGFQALAEPRPAEKRVAKVAGTSIQYDSGTVTGFFAAITTGRLLLNRYESALNAGGTAIVPVEQSGTITRISFEMLRTSRSTVTWGLYSDVMGTQAREIASPIIPVAVGLNTFTIDPMNTDNAYQGGSFLAGIFQLNVAFTRIGVDSNSAGGQGFHLHTLNEPQSANPNTGMGLREIPGLNLVFRVSGNLVTPIELQRFEIE
ncbi:MAG: hypothetical protein MI919_31160 [Holophagales bacterium]|nr:hypothetical protein [Holophagales bacterium]